MSFLDAMNFRHACKIFDNKEIPKNEFDQILEVGRFSPSSFGMEHSRFLVIQNEELKQKLQPLCWNQKQITTCSEVIVILAKTKDVVNDKYINFMFKRKGLNDTLTQGYIKKYKDFLTTQKDIYAWSSKQCYIALGNMMSYAAFLKIDSCPIEGFEKEKVEKLLNIDTSKEEVAVICTFGYRQNEQAPKTRLPLNQIVEYIG